MRRRLTNLALPDEDFLLLDVCLEFEGEDDKTSLEGEVEITAAVDVVLLLASCSALVVAFKAG